MVAHSAGLPNPRVSKVPEWIAAGRAQDRRDGAEPAEGEVDN